MLDSKLAQQPCNISLQPHRVDHFRHDFLDVRGSNHGHIDTQFSPKNLEQPANTSFVVTSRHAVHTWPANTHGRDAKSKDLDDVGASADAPIDVDFHTSTKDVGGVFSYLK
jgi:hypothetical protein